MFKRVALVLCAGAIFLSGCGDTGSTSEQVTASSVQVPIESGLVWNVKLPEGVGVAETDNCVYWKFTDDTTMYCTDKISHIAAKYNKDKNIYTTSTGVSKDFTSKTLAINSANKSDVESYTTSMETGEESQVDTQLYKENRIEKLPSHIDMSHDMEMTESNMYMPSNSTAPVLDVYKAELLCEGTDYLESWIQDGKLSEIESWLCTIAISNSGESSVTEWFKNDNTLLVKSGNHIVGAKKLKYNEWYIYSGTDKYEDYIITGLDKVHSSDN